MPVPIVTVAAAVGTGMSILNYVDSVMTNWMPTTSIVNRVKCQGQKGTPVRVTLHLALAALYGMSISKKGNAYSVTATVNHRDNIVEVESVLSATTFGGLSIGSDIVDNPTVKPPTGPEPGKEYDYPLGFSAPFPNNLGISPSDLPLEERIIGYSPNYLRSSITSPPTDDTDGNPKLIIKSVKDPSLYRGVNRIVTQPNPTKAPWLVKRV